MERVFGDDDLVGTVALHLAPLAGELDQPLDGLGAAVAEERLVHTAALAEQFRQLELRHGVVQVGDRDELLRLPRQRLNDDGVSVAEAGDGDAADEVEVLLAVAVPDDGAFAAFEHDRKPFRRLQVVFVLDLDPVFGLHVHSWPTLVPACAPSATPMSACS